MLYQIINYASIVILWIYTIYKQHLHGVTHHQSVSYLASMYKDKPEGDNIILFLFASIGATLEHITDNPIHYMIILLILFPSEAPEHYVFSKKLSKAIHQTNFFLYLILNMYISQTIKIYIVCSIAIPILIYIVKELPYSLYIELFYLTILNFAVQPLF